MPVRYFTQWDGKQFTSKPLRDLLAARIGWGIDVRLLTRRTPPPHGLHRYYRGILLPALHETMEQNGVEGKNGGPITERGVHLLLKFKFLYRTYWHEGEQKYKHFILSTADLTSDEFSDYVLRVELWMIDFWGIIINTPEFKEAGDKAGFMRRYFTGE